MWTSIVFGLLLITGSAFLFVRNQLAWRATRTSQHDAIELEFLQRQYRRRTQANIIMGIVGVAVIVGIWLTNTIVAAFFWMAVILIVGWMALLAIADQSLIHIRRCRRAI